MGSHPAPSGAPSSGLQRRPSFPSTSSAAFNPGLPLHFSSSRKPSPRRERALAAVAVALLFCLVLACSSIRSLRSEKALVTEDLHVHRSGWSNTHSALINKHTELSDHKQRLRSAEEEIMSSLEHLEALTGIISTKDGVMAGLLEERGALAEQLRMFEQQAAAQIEAARHSASQPLQAEVEHLHETVCLFCARLRSVLRRAALQVNRCFQDYTRALVELQKAEKEQLEAQSTKFSRSIGD